MNILTLKEDSFAHGTNWSLREPLYEQPKRSALSRWIDSFRPDPNGGRISERSSIIHASRNRSSLGIDGEEEEEAEEERRESEHHGPHYFDVKAANLGTASTLLARELKGRHLQMIAIGGSIGMTCQPFCVAFAA